ncbi:GAF domain-containing protein [Alteribacillus persepolensis]|uniref:GAF domain-containing protein n=1 Tax=Alteribacillus persepolensis TaxID=568899 RepID=A0A1G8BEL3_9BACI|nr:GAF domain-containing protein [Alteribacillus persepolensis]SDH31659.1 GAF domain-containing protein [Alteribacillus persepolensis]
MFQQVEYKGSTQEQYQLLFKQLEALLEGEPNQTANLSNAAALLYQFLPDVNWLGFYLYHPADNELILGPFQGLPACIRIPMNKGVCGTAAYHRLTERVPDVTQFPGHIACDGATQSEIVIPLMKEGKLVGVLDIDSPVHNRFSEEDQTYLEEFADLLIKYL